MRPSRAEFLARHPEIADGAGPGPRRPGVPPFDRRDRPSPRPRRRPTATPAARDDPGRLPPHPRGRPRRDGRRLRGPADLARPSGRGQGALRRRRARPAATAALPHRGPGRRAAQPRAHRAHLRRRLRSRHPLLRHAVHRGLHPRRGPRESPRAPCGPAIATLDARSPARRDSPPSVRMRPSSAVASADRAQSDTPPADVAPAAPRSRPGGASARSPSSASRPPRPSITPTPWGSSIATSSPRTC